MHNEVRLDLRDSDAKQLAATISRDLVYPIAVLNGLADNWKRCPRLVFPTDEPEDLKSYADSLPQLVKLGFRIPRQWAQEKVGIPEPAEKEDVLQLQAEPSAPAEPEPPAGVAVATAQQKPATTAAQRLDDDLQPITGQWITRIRQLVEQAESLEQIRDGLAELLPDMTLEQYAEAMAQALAAAALQGRLDIVQEAANGR